jgi:hypothetical protein
MDFNLNLSNVKSDKSPPRWAAPFPSAARAAKTLTSSQPATQRPATGTERLPEQ